MRLTLRNIHYYLLDKGFIDMHSLVDGDYSVVQGQTRNLVFRITRKKATSLFVKQLNSFDPSNTYVLQKDATCLWLIKNNPAFDLLSGYVPGYFGFDPERQVLITEYVPNAINLEDYVRNKGTLSDTILDDLAAILASYHFPVSDALLSSTSVQFFPKQLPWVLTIAATPSGNGQQQSLPVNNPAMAAVMGNKAFSKILAGIKSIWQSTSLIHGDIKWVNLLLCNDGEQQKLKVIDWEIADIGDPLWDVAGVFQSLILDAILYDNEQQTSTYNMATGITLTDMNRVWPTIQSFWNMYCIKMNTKPEAWQYHNALEKSILYTGARLIQTATEHNMMASTLQFNAMKLLQASYAILTNVSEVITRLHLNSKPAIA